jgi:hypothetical protein
MRIVGRKNTCPLIVSLPLRVVLPGACVGDPLTPLPPSPRLVAGALMILWWILGICGLAICGRARGAVGPAELSGNGQEG